MSKNLEINFFDPDAPKNDMPYERKQKQVLCTIDKILLEHAPASKPFSLERLAIFGSRSLKDDRVHAIIDNYIAGTGARVIITAFEPAGICHSAQTYAQKNKIPLELHFLNIGKYARGAHEHRSDEVILASDATLFIHDGHSRGTYNEILRSIKFAKPYFYEYLPEIKDEGMFCNVG